MKSLILLFLSLILGLAGFCQSVNICVSADCKDTIQLPTDTITLNSQANSSAPVTSYVWRAINNHTIIDDIFSSHTVARGLDTPGIYVYSVTVSSAIGFASAYDTIILKAAPANQSPFAVIAVRGTPTSVILDGTGSFDNDGRIVQYNWQGPGVNSSQQIITIKNVAVGSYTYMLTVTDNKGAKNTATLRLFNSSVTQVVTVIAYIFTNGKTVTVYSNGTTITQ